jgi:hypothetical protein
MHPLARPGVGASSPHHITIALVTWGLIRIWNHMTSFGQDARGEIYVVDQGGEIFKLVPGS